MTRAREAFIWAQALIDVTGAIEDADRIGENISFVLKALEKYRGLEGLLAYPSIDARSRVMFVSEFIKEALGQDIEPVVVSLLELLIQRRKIGLLKDIMKAYDAAIIERKGFVPATVISARGLTMRQIERLRGVLEGRLGRKVEINVRQDPEIIGGIRVVAGDTVIDGTISSIIRRIFSFQTNSARQRM
ncbi:MAG TPA: ATP synthase F1 subunit delta [Firmicutes bacterium]|nr:ATP synthase F1 subunit delta [Bacillota bacterium]